MTVDRARRALELFDEARDLSPSDRPGFLEDACGDDERLRREPKSPKEDHSPEPSVLDNQRHRHQRVGAHRPLRPMPQP